ncbi:BTAD domain-containing putative transcriptional regulator [Kutzneria kofuensis]|uniref:DNA-binding SARP family transcriptional activator/Tfp pilus assembly protein PilF n=2 Tax=Kutzneria kofuensis TaxID=103725 RepID=A0A7W9NMG5_9PSEU|nr:BTAD domain-containing putative transcriptional regulator [Kutzneria kofuensis]MBB5898100.1 DNA-binding SARP family transcriptional activator/Tfp pilus assembly protein PilF [Kutzneria kofuensis]
MAVEFRLLGPVTAVSGGRSVDLGPAQQRCVLATLLVQANHLLPVEQLVNRVWGHDPPQRHRAVLYTYLSRLRKTLATTGVTIARRSGGYVLSVDETAVDLHRFRHLVAKARASQDDRQALALFEQALGLWRAEAFTDLDTPWLVNLRTTLDAERRAVELDRIDTALRCGRHAELLPILSTLAAQHPLDERVAGQLMLALYRSGRQADALQHYHHSRQRLAEELGTDPGAPLQSLHQQILTADPDLASPTHGTARSHRPPVPHQLPAPPRWFTGRTDELTALSQALDAESAATVVISAIGGVGGIGKTWLALHWAYQHLDRFPDGQLYVNLRGFDPTGQPMPAEAAVRGFLDALGIAPDAHPVDPDAQAALYRSLVAGKQMLILLDNARDAAQVAPLLPGSPTCTVVVTSRDRLTGLISTHGAHPLALDVLDEPAARDLLARRLGGDRLAAEPEAVAELLAFCAGLPLALTIVAGRAQTHPDFPLATLAAELRDAATRLIVLDEDAPAASLPAVLSWSYHALATEQARVFGLLGIAPGWDISLPAVAGLTALPAGRARAVLRDLERVSLIQQQVPGRYRMHDLIGLYAADQAHRDHPENVREAALRRLLDFYTHTAYAAARRLDPHRPDIRLDPPAPGTHPHPLPDDPAAMAWLASEHTNLLAAQRTATTRARHHAVWQLAWSLTTFHVRRGHLHDQLAVWRFALDAAEHLPDPTTRTLARRRLGVAYAKLGRHEEAIEHLHRALALAEHHHSPAEQAHTHRMLAIAWERRGDDRRALDHATRALDLHRTFDQPVGEAHALNLVGWYAGRLGEYATARAHCLAALTLHHHNDPDGEARTLDTLGYIDHHTGHHHQAVHHYQHALDLFRSLGHAYDAAGTLDGLGHPHAALGQHEQARTVWREALELYRQQGRDEDADRVRRQLDALDHE